MALPFQAKRKASDIVPALVAPSGATSYTAGRKLAIFDSIPVIKNDSTLHLATNGKWSSHQLLIHLLDLTGPAHVSIATYSMTEEPTKMLVNYLEIGQIKSLQFVSDIRFKTHQPEAYALAIKRFPIHLVNTHMKLMVIWNEKWNISVVGSANFTNNKRREIAIVIEDKSTCEFYKSVIQDIINGTSPE